MNSPLILPPSLGLRGIVSRTGWLLPNDMTEDEWWAAGEVFGKVESSYGWWLGDWWLAFKPDWGKRAEIAGSDEWLDRGLPPYKTCCNAGTVADGRHNGFETSRRREVLTWKHHSEVVSLLRPDQEDLLDWCEVPIASTGRPRSTSELRAEIIRRRQQHILLDMSLPGERFPVLYIDPPWRYENPPMGGSNRSIENHYPTMALDEICALPVADLAMDNAMLYLWATAPKLAECFAVIDAWGFTYRTNVVWVKDKIGMGYHARSQHELLLICKRGELPPPMVEDRVSSVVFADREEHSKKPVAFYELIERWYPTLPKIELFARAPRAGWAGWGNQLAVAAE